MATQPPIADFVDVERYPISDLENLEAARLVESCHDELQRTGACKLDGFLRLEAVARMAEAGAELAAKGFPNDDVHNVYFTEIDETLPVDDPRRILVRSAQKAVAMDILPPDFPTRQVYEWDGLTRFVAAVLGKDVLYRSADPLDGCNLTVYEPGDELGWHFDNSEFSITLMAQPAERGGEFEYVPMIRTPEDENYRAVRSLLLGSREGVIPFPSGPGALGFFRGRYSIHRVPPVEGSRPRLNSVLTYAAEPGHKLSPLTQKLFYGRIV